MQQLPLACSSSPPFVLALLVVVPEPPSFTATAVESDFSIRPASSAKQPARVCLLSPPEPRPAPCAAAAGAAPTSEGSRRKQEDEESCCHQAVVSV
jgi:hypothetical protein